VPDCFTVIPGVTDARVMPEAEAARAELAPREPNIPERGPSPSRGPDTMTASAIVVIVVMNADRPDILTEFVDIAPFSLLELYERS
jgi:hypothetical protein